MAKEKGPREPGKFKIGDFVTRTMSSSDRTDYEFAEMFDFEPDKFTRADRKENKSEEAPKS